MNITLKNLVENGIVDENQKLWVYEWRQDLQTWVGFVKGRACMLIDKKENEKVFNTTEFTIQEIRKKDLEYLIKNNFKKDYIGIYICE